MKSITSVSLLSVWLLLTLAACAGPLAPPTGSSSTAGPGAPPMTPVASAPTASAAAATAPTSAAVSPTAQPRLSATRPTMTTDRHGPLIAQVRNGGNVRTLPSKQGSKVLDQINAGETVLLRMRSPNGEWYSIVDPRGDGVHGILAPQRHEELFGRSQWPVPFDLPPEPFQQRIISHGRCIPGRCAHLAVRGVRHPRWCVQRGRRRGGGWSLPRHAVE
jgi:hypothetical protein